MKVMTSFHRILVLTAALVCCLSLQAAEERNLLTSGRSEQTVAAVLLDRSQWMPYPDYQDRSGWDKILGTSKDALIKKGEKFLGYQWQYLKASQYLDYVRKGSRAPVNVPTVQNVSALSSLLIAELAEGKGRFLSDIIDGVMFFCEQTSWAEPAHLTAYQKVKSPLPDYTENILELRQGGIAQMLSFTYYFLNKEMDKVDPLIAKRLRHELQVKELDPFLTRNDFWWMGFNTKVHTINNWNPWCNSNALFCFMLLEDDKATLAKAVWKSMTSVDKFLNFVKGDGCCEEGTSYWESAAGKLYDYLSALSLLTGGKINIFDQPLVKKMGEYIVNSYIGNGWVVNFADASARAGAVRPGLIFNYGKAVHSDLMQNFAASLQREKKTTATALNWMDFYRSIETVRALPEMAAWNKPYRPATFVEYPETEVCYVRNGANFMAVKGGHNNESHNHNDIGTFVYYRSNLPVIIDAGVGTYTSKTFSKDRYTIWTMQSQYHNLPVINGQGQVYGQQYHSGGFTASEKRHSVTVQLAGAYPKETGIENWKRNYQLNKKGISITDDFVLSKATTPVVINFLTWGDQPTVSEGKVMIHAAGQQSAIRFDARLFTAKVETIALPDKRLSDVWGPQIYRVSLTAKTAIATGSYEYSVTEE